MHDILNITQNTLPSEIENILDKRLKDEQNKSETNQKIVKNFCLQAKFILLDPQRREEYEKQMFESLDKELNKKIKHVKKKYKTNSIKHFYYNSFNFNINCCYIN